MVETFQKKTEEGKRKKFLEDQAYAFFLLFRDSLKIFSSKYTMIIISRELRHLYVSPYELFVR